MFDYAGCIHFHSSYSYDALIPPERIIEAALRSGLDYAVLTDHFRLDARHDGWERYHSLSTLYASRSTEHVKGEGSSVKGKNDERRVLLLIGEEISPRYNHYLAFGLQEAIVVEKNHANAQEVIDCVQQQGGFGFIAHPDHAGAPLIGARAFPWVAWEATGYAGLGIWDLMSDWSASLRSPWSVIGACLWPARRLRGPSMKTLARWDELAQRSHCVAVGEIDNHGQMKRYFGIRRQIFPYEFAFRTIRTHVLLPEVLTGDVAKDREAIWRALREGHSYVSLDLWQSPQGFSFRIFDAHGDAHMGGTFQRRGPALVEIKLPTAGRLRLVRNGRLIYEESRRPYLQRDVTLPGVYRVEVEQRVMGRWRPWIYSNPIWVQ